MIRLYVLYHDDDSLQEAKKFSDSRDWAQPFLLSPSTFLLEYFFFTNRLNYEDYHDFKWVGTVSYKVVKKLGHENIPRMENLMNDNLENTDIHVLAFFGNTEFENIGTRDELCHPGLTTLIKKVLELAGEDPQDINSFYSPSLKQFYSAYFVTRPHWMCAFIEWFQKIVVLLCVNLECNQLCLRSSTYEPNQKWTEIAQRIYGLSYLPMYPFFCERMVPYFFHTRGANIIVLDD